MRTSRGRARKGPCRGRSSPKERRSRGSRLRRVRQDSRHRATRRTRNDDERRRAVRGGNLYGLLLAGRDRLGERALGSADSPAWVDSQGRAGRRQRGRWTPPGRRSRRRSALRARKDFGWCALLRFELQRPSRSSERSLHARSACWRRSSCDGYEERPECHARSQLSARTI